MKITSVLLALCATTLATPVSDLHPRNPDALHSSTNPQLSHKRSQREEIAALTPRDASPEPEPYAPAPPNHDLASLSAALEKRKGGGGGRGGSSSGSSGGRSSGSGSSGGGRPISSYSFSPQSNAGGRTTRGSGTSPAYGNRYMGGATVPYTAGRNSPSRGIAPFALPLAGFAILPGAALAYGYLYAYPYYGAGYGGYHYHEDGQNKTSNVTCVCQRYQVCGCDPQNNNTEVAQMLTNGTGKPGDPPVNTSTVRTVTFDNGTTMSYINGSLANGTTAPGGTEPSSEDEISAAVKQMLGLGGYGVMAATVVWGVWMGGLP